MVDFAAVQQAYLQQAGGYNDHPGAGYYPSSSSTGPAYNYGDDSRGLRGRGTPSIVPGIAHFPQHGQQLQPGGGSMQMHPSSSTPAMLMSGGGGRGSVDVPQQTGPGLGPRGGPGANLLNMMMNPVLGGGNMRPARAKSRERSRSLRPGARTRSVGSDQGSNIRVVVRVRPPLAREMQAASFQKVCRVENDRKVTLHELVPDSSKEDGLPFIVFANHVFNFDFAHGPDNTQEDVYKSTGSFATAALLRGFNATILAYGQTGTGKTHTMEGFCYDSQSEKRGVIARCMDNIFHSIGNFPDPKARFIVRASYLQIYNEQISDLLKTHNGGVPVPAGSREYLRGSVAGAIPNLRERSHERWGDDGEERGLNLVIREDKSRGVFVDGISEWIVQSSKEVYQLIERGGKERVIAQTKSNDISSRSHTVFMIVVEQQTAAPQNFTNSQGDAQSGETGTQMRIAKLNLVDLAGSERVHWTGAKGQQLEESKKINTSLLALGNVIQALADTKCHVPYRDSKLTRLLEDSLGGNCVTTIVAMVSPAYEAFQESLSTLKFASRAKSIVNAPVLNVVNADEKTTLIRQYQQEIKSLKEQLSTLSRNGAAKGRPGLPAELSAGGADGTPEGAHHLMSELQREKNARLEAERRLSEYTSTVLQPFQGALPGGGDTASSVGNFTAVSADRHTTTEAATSMIEHYEEKLSQLEAERVTIKEDRSQIARYKQLLLKQRDIMRTFTQRLRERDDSILNFQADLDAAHIQIDDLRARLDTESDAARYEAEISQLQGRIVELEQNQSGVEDLGKQWSSAIEKLQEIQQSEQMPGLAKVRLRNQITQMCSILQTQMGGTLLPSSSLYTQSKLSAAAEQAGFAPEARQLEGSHREAQPGLDQQYHSDAGVDVNDVKDGEQQLPGGATSSSDTGAPLKLTVPTPAGVETTQLTTVLTDSKTTPSSSTAGTKLVRFPDVLAMDSDYVAVNDADEDLRRRAAAIRGNVGGSNSVAASSTGVPQGRGGLTRSYSSPQHQHLSAAQRQLALRQEQIQQQRLQEHRVQQLQQLHVHQQGTSSAPVPAPAFLFQHQQQHMNMLGGTGSNTGLDMNQQLLQQAAGLGGGPSSLVIAPNPSAPAAPFAHNPHYPQNTSLYELMRSRPVAAMHHLLAKPRSRSLPSTSGGTTRGTAIGRRRRASRSPGNITPANAWQRRPLLST
ncbi:unnamed protein product [Amoebophrya sp. A25]|nr:unnamed protein product [Amoebophrya sp. A25]|eukprot:GSA25T00023536001.1